MSVILNLLSEKANSMSNAKETEKKWNPIDYLKTIPAIGFAVLIIYFSSLSNPLPSRPKGVPTNLDINTILHIGEFAVLGFLIAFGFFDKFKQHHLLSFGVIFAVSDEIHQYFVPSRYFDVFDILMDIIGVLMGFISYLLLYKIIHQLKARKTSTLKIIIQKN